MFVGQSYDLYWVYNVACPSIPDYLRMIDSSQSHLCEISQGSTTEKPLTFRLIETGGLFRMITRLMIAESPLSFKSDLDNLACLFGRYFQIRDDYMNLSSPDVSQFISLIVTPFVRPICAPATAEFSTSTPKPKVSAKISTKANILYRSFTLCKLAVLPPSTTNPARTSLF